MSSAMRAASTVRKSVRGSGGRRLGKVSVPGSRSGGTEMSKRAKPSTFDRSRPNTSAPSLAVREVAT